MSGEQSRKLRLNLILHDAAISLVLVNLDILIAESILALGECNMQLKSFIFSLNYRADLVFHCHHILADLIAFNLLLIVYFVKTRSLTLFAMDSLFMRDHVITKEEPPFIASSMQF